MKKIIRLTESNLIEIINKTLEEQSNNERINNIANTIKSLKPPFNKKDWVIQSSNPKLNGKKWSEYVKEFKVSIFDISAANKILKSGGGTKTGGGIPSSGTTQTRKPVPTQIKKPIQTTNPTSGVTQTNTTLPQPTSPIQEQIKKINKGEKTIRLTESDLIKLIKNIIDEGSYITDKGLTMSDDYEDLTQSIEPGDAVDFKNYGLLYVITVLSDGFVVSDDEEQRYMGDEGDGYFIPLYAGEEAIMIDKGEDDGDDELNDFLGGLGVH